MKFNFSQATHIFTDIKSRINNNADQLNGWNDTFKHMTNSFEQDPFRMAYKPLLKQDLDIGSIDTVPTTQLIRKIFPMEGVYNTLVSPTGHGLMSYKSFFYNPRSGSFDGGIPMDGVSHPIIRNHSLMTEYFKNKGFTPMSEDLISSHGIMWKTLNHVAESLVNSSIKELGALEHAVGGLIGYDATDCVLHILISQTPDSISLVYGNIFTLVKIGNSFRKVWVDYHTYDYHTAFTDGCPVPLSIWEYTQGLAKSVNINKGYHIYVGIEDSLKNNLGTYDTSDILERVGARALGLKGIIPSTISLAL